MAAVRPAGPEPMIMTRSMGATDSTGPGSLPVATGATATRAESLLMALEDDFCDVLTKAMRGMGEGPAELAKKTGLDARAIDRWRRGRDTPSEDQARALAAPLQLDAGKLADAA